MHDSIPQGIKCHDLTRYHKTQEYYIRYILTVSIPMIRVSIWSFTQWYTMTHAQYAAGLVPRLECNKGFRCWLFFRWNFFVKARRCMKLMVHRSTKKTPGSLCWNGWKFLTNIRVLVRLVREPERPAIAPAACLIFRMFLCVILGTIFFRNKLNSD